MTQRTLTIPPAWRHLIGGLRTAEVEGETVGEILTSLAGQFPVLKEHIFDGVDVREYTIVFVGDVEIHQLQGLATPLPPGVQVRILMAMSGG